MRQVRVQHHMFNSRLFLEQHSLDKPPRARWVELPSDPEDASALETSSYHLAAERTTATLHLNAQHAKPLVDVVVHWLWTSTASPHITLLQAGQDRRIQVATVDPSHISRRVRIEHDVPAISLPLRV